MRSTIPRIPHLPGSHVHPDDLLLTHDEARPFLTRQVEVREKLDGISLTVRASATGELEAGLKVDWRSALDGAVERAANLWVRLNEDRLRPLLVGGGELLGEWLWHRLVLPYELPSPVLFYARRDRQGRLLPFPRPAKGLCACAPVFEGVLGDRPLASLCRRSQLGRVRAEGLIIELRTPQGVRWAKWVRKGYRQPPPGKLSGKLNHLRCNDAL